MEHDVITTYCNPLQVQVADPWVVLHEGVYYLYGAHDRNPHAGIPVYTSSDLTHWEWRGFALKKHRKNFAQHFHGSPAVRQVGDAFYMYLCASPHATPNPPFDMQILLARSDAPLGPFEEYVAPLFEPEDEAGTIDPHLFIDDDGAPYLFWAHVTAGEHQIRYARMEADLTEPAAAPEIVLTPDQPWESHAWKGHCFVAGPHVYKHDGAYYLLYTGNHLHDPHYAIGYARAPQITGPWTKYAGNPILQQSDAVFGTGKGVITVSPDASELILAYHTPQRPRDVGWRQLAMDRLRFAQQGAEHDDAPAILVDGPTHTPQPLPGGATPRPVARSFQHFGDTLDRAQWQVINEAPKAWELKKGKLYIHTQDGDMWKDHADFQNLFLQHAPEGDFVLKAQVEFHPAQNYEQAFIIVFQDHDHYVRLSHAFDDDLEFLAAHEIAGTFHHSSLPNTLESEVWLAIRKEGNRYTMSASADNEEWTTVGSCEAALERISVGLGAISPCSGSERTAAFSNFIIEAFGQGSTEALATATVGATTTEDTEATDAEDETDTAETSMSTEA